MNVPKLRFSGFNTSYIIEKLNNLVAIYDGTHETPNYTSSGVKFVSVENINNLLHSDKYISLEEFDKYKIKPKYNDVFMTRIGDIGTSAIYKSNDNLAYYVSLALLRTKNQLMLYPDYLNQYIKSSSFQKELYKRTIHVAFPKKINTCEIGECNIIIPEYIEQKKIAQFLSLLDKKIELQTKKIEALKLFKLYILQNVFNEEKLNDFQSVILEKILKPGSKIPVKNISAYEKMTVKLNFKGLAKLEAKKEMADTRPFYVRNENEIIIGKQNYFNGSIAKVTKEFKGCICSNAIMSFTTINDVNVDYVLYYLSQKNYINRRKFLANGTGQKELSEKEFLKFVIKLPPIQIQNNISKKISCVNNLLLLENKKRITLNNLKKGLLQNLFV